MPVLGHLSFWNECRPSSGDTREACRERSRYYWNNYYKYSTVWFVFISSLVFLSLFYLLIFYKYFILNPDFYLFIFRTRLDDICSLRIWGKLDDVFTVSKSPPISPHLYVSLSTFPKQLLQTEVIGTRTGIGKDRAKVFVRLWRSHLQNSLWC
jgi:hypothetical protein